MLTIEKIRIVAELYKREKESAGSAHPTDEEVIAATEVSYALIDLGNQLNLEMLASWAVMRFQHYNGVASARGIQGKIKHWTTLDKEKENNSAGVSADWVLAQLGGMKFINPNGTDAYDFIKTVMKLSGIKTS